jgi:formate hydrogenlyase subunit 5
MAASESLHADQALDPPVWRDEVLARLDGGARFAGLYATDRDGAAELRALLTTRDGFDCLRVLVPTGADGVPRYRALSTDVPAAFWYERALHDLSGVVPDGHPRLDPLLLPVPAGAEHPRPGRVLPTAPVSAADASGPVDVTGHVFTLPFGPVRSGVMESIELLLETPGEDIPHLNIRPHYKHRGIAKRFEGLTPERGVLVAERVEGISSVAHALAYCHAVESLTQVAVPRRAALLRVVHAELERIANHLDVTMRLADAAGLAVATSRFGWHKETVLRLVSRMCGSRFGRGAVVPGGVRAMPAMDGPEVAKTVSRLHRLVRADIAALENSASFLDRLRTTGPLSRQQAREHGALGPIGRGSGFDDDDRRHRPYDSYPLLPAVRPARLDAGDALSRARVRWHEIATSAELVRTALDLLPDTDPALRVSVEAADGFTLGWAEAAQGEVLYGLELTGGVIRRCFARSASFHNLVLFHDVFAGDVFTDLPFIEASFGLSYAGVAM